MEQPKRKKERKKEREEKPVNAQINIQLRKLSNDDASQESGTKTGSLFSDAGCH